MSMSVCQNISKSDKVLLVQKLFDPILCVTCIALMLPIPVGDSPGLGPYH